MTHEVMSRPGFVADKAYIELLDTVPQVSGTPEAPTWHTEEERRKNELDRQRVDELRQRIDALRLSDDEAQLLWRISADIAVANVYQFIDTSDDKAALPDWDSMPEYAARLESRSAERFQYAVEYDLAALPQYGADATTGICRTVDPETELPTIRVNEVILQPAELVNAYQVIVPKRATYGGPDEDGMTVTELLAQAQRTTREGVTVAAGAQRYLDDIEDALPVVPHTVTDRLAKIAHLGVAAAGSLALIGHAHSRKQDRNQ